MSRLILTKNCFFSNFFVNSALEFSNAEYGIKESDGFKKSQNYEIDEMQSHIGSKQHRVWIIYSLEKKTKKVVDFVVGRRTGENARKVVTKVLEFSPKSICSDKLNIYPSIIPKSIQVVKQYGTNYIERKNLTLRTNLKRLFLQNRKVRVDTYLGDVSWKNLT